MEEKILGTVVVGLVGTLLTVSRRYGNEDTNAGLGIAGWTMFVIVVIWI